MPSDCTTPVPANLNSTSASLDFVRLLLTSAWPDLNTSAQPQDSEGGHRWAISAGHWATSTTAPFTRSSRYFCCGTAQRAHYACGCLKLPRNSKESWPTCEAHEQARRAAMTPCLVYSFGIAMQWEFDDRMADSGCEVHSFDPTGAYIATHEAHVKRGVTFHPWGLSGGTPRAGCSDDSRRFSGGTYGNLTGPLLSLDRIVRRLGHVGRRISVLKVDCEGCEWDAFHHLATLQPPELVGRIDAIYVELHLALQMATSADLIKWASLYDLLFTRSGFRLWWLHENRARAPGSSVHSELQRHATRLSHEYKRRPAVLAGAWELGLIRVEEPPGAEQAGQQAGTVSAAAGAAEPLKACNVHGRGRQHHGQGRR